MRKVELIIGVGANQISLDLTPNAISIALQYSIDDIRNIEKKNSNYSKNITLPGTKKNNDAFGNLFDVNSTFDIYNPNKKIEARIVVDSSPVLQGYLQLTAVNKVNNVSLQGNKIEYNVIVFDDSIDFFQTVGDKLVKDLDISAFDHTYNQTNIENAWNTHTFSDVYQYPLLDKNTQGYETVDFKPCFYHKGLLLKVAEENGYKLEGSFITTDENGNGPNLQYNKELIAWDGETPKLTDSQVLSRKFKGNINTASDLIGTYVKDNFNFLGGLVFGNEIESDINYEDITSTGLFDNTGTYNSNGTLSYWEVSQSGRYDFVFNHRFKVTVENLDLVNSAVIRHKPHFTIQNTRFKIYVRVELWDAVTNTRVASTVSNLGYFSSLNPGDTETTDVDRVITINNYKATQGQELYPVFVLTSNEKFGWNYLSGSEATDVELELTVYDTLNAGGTSSWYNTPAKASNIIDGDNIEVGLYLPKKIKQRDLFNDLVRRYNLYIRRHPINQKVLILETRDDFYDTTTVLDWTQKKDYSQEDNVKFLAELQDKEIIFSYKEDDSSPYNEAYTESTGDLYGQKKIEFDNDFTQNTKNITSIFSTAPLLYKGLEGNDVVVPNIDSADGKRNPSLLYWGGLLDCKNSEGVNSSFDINFGGTIVTRTTYPYAGHYDNPYTPTLDIHFGVVTFEYYGILLNSITDNNLFNKYWRNYVDQISSGKLITSNFYLKETDINFIKDNLNARIFIKDSYYVINKITDYKPLQDGLTKVELLQIQEGSTFAPTDTPPTITFTPSNQLSEGTFQPVASTIESRNGNNINTRRASVIGSNNYMGGGSSGVINGDNNTIGGNSNGINVQGNNNVVSGGLENVSIIGNDATVTESNTSVINGVVFSDGVLTTSNEGRYVEIALGDWDMDATNSISTAHGLSATEWKTIRDLSVTVRDDLDSAVFDFTSYPSNTILSSSTNIVTSRLATGFFDSTAFDSTSYNRGWVTFKYKPD